MHFGALVVLHNRARCMLGQLMFLTRRIDPRCTKLQRSTQVGDGERWIACTLRVPVPPSCIAFPLSLPGSLPADGGVFKNARHVHTGGSTGYTSIAIFAPKCLLQGSLLRECLHSYSFPRQSSGISHASVAPHTLHPSAASCAAASGSAEVVEARTREKESHGIVSLRSDTVP